MKRSSLRRRSKSPQKKLESELWQECRRIIEEQYGTNCYTCSAKNLQGKNRQLGHVPWPKASLGAYLKYDIRVLRYQCFRCNINMGGNGALAYARMTREEGKSYMDKLEHDRNITVKSTLSTKEWYAKLLEEYKLLKK